ncbi:MAG: MurR/RpiR family transcriptional regulator [Synergistales bacterium]|nr:MurR/RpiR family transcriptional regulator [Synergistales bacterium]
MIRQRIHDRFKELSAGQTRIARFLLSKPREAAFLTASALGNRTDVSESTVVRFATLLGYSGYPELRRAVQEELKNQLSTAERLQSFQEETQLPEQELASYTMHMDHSCLGEATSHVSQHELSAFAEALAEAEQILVVGRRSAKSLAVYLSYYLSWLHEQVELLEGEFHCERFLMRPKGWFVVGLSFPRYTAETVAILQQAKEQGLTTGAITDSVASPVAESTDLILTAPYSPVSFIDSFTTPMSVLNALLLEVAGRVGHDRVEKRLEHFEELWAGQGIYLRQKR